MRTHHLVILAACGSLFALPAFAQNQHHNGNSATQGQSPSGSSAMQSQNDNSSMQGQDHNGTSAMQGQNQAMQSGKSPRQMLTQELKQAGFSHIRIEPETFVVHAINHQGEPVLMQISPDSVEAVTALKEPNHQQAQNDSQQSGSSEGNNNIRQQ